METNRVAKESDQKEYKHVGGMSPKNHVPQFLEIAGFDSEVVVYLDAYVYDKIMDHESASALLF